MFFEGNSSCVRRKDGQVRSTRGNQTWINGVLVSPLFAKPAVVKDYTGFVIQNFASLSVYSSGETDNQLTYCEYGDCFLTLKPGSSFSTHGAGLVHVSLGQYDTIEMINAGDVECTDVTCRKMIITTTTGDVDIIECMCTKLNVRSVSGDVTCSGDFDRMTMHSATGNIQWEGSGSDMMVSTHSGNIKLTGIGNANVSTMSGRVKCSAGIIMV